MSTRRVVCGALSVALYVGNMGLLVPRVGWALWFASVLVTFTASALAELSNKEGL